MVDIDLKKPTTDWIINGKKVEFKSLGKADKVNINTGVTRLQKATGKDGVQVIDLDIRDSKGTKEDAILIYNRFKGTKEGKAFKGEVRIATQDGLFSNFPKAN